MAEFKKKFWRNNPDKSTPITQGSLNHLEARVAGAFADLQTGIKVVPHIAPPPPGDITGPTCTFVTPTAGQSVFGSIIIEVDAQDNPGGKGVWFVTMRLDDPTADPTIMVIKYARPFQWIIDTTTLSQGPHTLYAQAADNAAPFNYGPVANMTFIVDNTAYNADSGKPAAVRGRGYSVIYEDNFSGAGNWLDNSSTFLPGWERRLWYEGIPEPGFGPQYLEISADNHLFLRTGSALIWHNPGAPSPYDQGNYPRVSIATFGHFQAQYGYFECRMKWTDGKAAWPGFWLYSVRHAANPDWPTVNQLCSQQGEPDIHCVAGEIDIFEGQGGPSLHPDYFDRFGVHWWEEDKKFFGTIHQNSAGNDNNGNPIYGVYDAQNFPNEYFSGNYDPWKTDGINLSQDFHVYAARWTPTEIAWYLDDVLLKVVTPYASLNQPMFIIFSNWVGGWSWPLSDETPAELEVEIDWVRVWQQSGDFHSFS